MMTLDVIAKYAFNTGITDVIEIYSMHLGNVTYLALANVTERDEHPRFSLYLPKLMMG
jgi:hypothetical protein